MENRYVLSLNQDIVKDSAERNNAGNEFLILENVCFTKSGVSVLFVQLTMKISEANKCLTLSLPIMSTMLLSVIMSCVLMLCSYGFVTFVQLEDAEKLVQKEVCIVFCNTGRFVCEGYYAHFFNCKTFA